MKKTLLSGIVFASLSIGSAFAADTPPAPAYKATAPVTAPASNWTGLYWGVHGGYGWGDADRLVNVGDVIFGLFPLVSPFQSDASTGIDGGIFGGHLGFNWQVGPNWVVGLEGSLAWSGMDGVADSPIVPGLFSITTDVNWIATVTPRLGWANNGWLLYVKGGLAVADVDTEISFPGLPASANTKFAGWTAGVGLDYAWTPNWIFGLEYNYYDLGKENVGGSYLPALPIMQTLDLEFSTVLARLSYKH